jgi:amino acid transporter
MTVLAAWKLRRTLPDLPRPFRIPWGRAGLLYVVGAPLVMAGVALLGSDCFALRWGPVAILIGPIAYLVMRKMRQRYERKLKERV